MRLRLAELQELDAEAQKIRAEELKKGLDKYVNVDGVLHHQKLPFVPEIIWTELISHHYDNPLAGHFGINKTRELIDRIYYWPSLKKDVEAYVRGCDVCLASKTVKHKPYGDLQALPAPIHQWKNLSMDFVTGLLISTDWKSHHQCSGASQSYFRHGSSTPWPAWFNRFW